jgi:hypothetical protein
MIDLMVYRAEGWAVRGGRDLYAMHATHAALPATYPPFAALLFAPLTLLDVADLRTLATVVNLALLVVLVHLSLRLVGRPLRAPRPAAALLLASLAVWCEPVWTTLRYGQINLLLAVLVLWDLTRRDGHRWAGACIGVAAGIKLAPAMFAVYLALCGLAEAARRLREDRGRLAPAEALRASWNAPLRQAAVATGAFLATVALSAVLLPRDSWHFWTRALFHTSRVGNSEDTGNQSVSGVLARLLHTGDPGLPALAAVLLTAAAGLAVAVAARRTGPGPLPTAPAWAVVACAVTGLLVSPYSWSHHWVWCVPLVLLLGTEARRCGGAVRRTAAWLTTAAFCSYALWWVPHSPDRADRLELHQDAAQMLLSAVYPLTGAAFLAAAAVTVRRARSGRAEGVEALQGAVLVEKPAVDGLAVQLTVGLDRVALYDQRPRAVLTPVLEGGVDGLHVPDDRGAAAAPVALPAVCTHRQLQLWRQAVHTWVTPPSSLRIARALPLGRTHRFCHVPAVGRSTRRPADNTKIPPQRDGIAAWS